MNKSSQSLLAISAIPLLLCSCMFLPQVLAQEQQPPSMPMPCPSANETYAECASACEPKCGDKKDMACILMCMPAKCQCSQGFVRNPASGQCVSPVDCPPSTNSSRCGRNEVYSECATCDPSCSEPNPICAEYCRQGCQCVPGTVRNAANQCVPQSKCSPRLTCANVRCAGGQCRMVGGRPQCVPVDVAEPVPVASS